MNININSNNLNLFKIKNINKIGKTNKINNHSNEKEEKSNSSLTIKQNNKQNSLIENLQKQKQDFISQKQALNNKDMDPTEKKYKVEDLNKNIQEIEAQIQQVNIQQKQEEIQKQQDDMLKKKVEETKYQENGDEIRDDIIISASLNELIKYSNSKENIHLLKDSKNRQKVEAQYIKPDDNPNSYNNKRLSQISKSIATIDSSIINEVKNINKDAERIKYKTTIATEQLKDQKDADENIDKKNTEEKIQEK